VSNGVQRPYQADHVLPKTTPMAAGKRGSHNRPCYLIDLLRQQRDTATELAARALCTFGLVAVRYTIAADGGISFALGSYHRTRPLLIDPLLVYRTLLCRTLLRMCCSTVESQP
jgi:hypothetical protein